MGRGLCREAETVSGSDPAGIQGDLGVFAVVLRGVLVALPVGLAEVFALAFGASFDFALAGAFAVVDCLLPAAGC